MTLTKASTRKGPELEPEWFRSQQVDTNGLGAEGDLTSIFSLESLMKERC